MKVFKVIWNFFEAMAEGRRMRIEKQVQEYIKNRT